VEAPLFARGFRRLFDEFPPVTVSLSLSAVLSFFLFREEFSGISGVISSRLFDLHLASLGSLFLLQELQPPRSVSLWAVLFPPGSFTALRHPIYLFQLQIGFGVPAGPF